MTHPTPPRRVGSLLAAMFAAVAAVAVLAFLDEARESEVALQEFGAEQARLAESLVAALHRAAPADEATLLEILPTLVPGGHRTLLWVTPQGARGSHGEPRSSEPVTRAFAAGERVARLSRAESAALGLPERTSMVGMASLDLPHQPHAALAVVASAERERDRDRRAGMRVLVSVLVGASLVMAFGGFALRRQRQELELARELAVLEMARDRDERLAQQNRSAMLLTLASGIAHELGTPLAVIHGRTEQLLNRPQEDERSTSALRTILGQSERIQEVVRGFLFLARGGTPSLTDVPPEAILHGAQQLVEHRFEAAGVELTLEMPSGPCPLLRGNQLLLEQALVNLLLNACDACGRGGHVRLKLLHDAGEVAFQVSDDGPGIQPEVAARATEAFFSTKPEGKGTGLGLAIASEIAKIHRGSLHVVPGTGRGTRVSIEVPLTPGGSHAGG